MLLKVEVLTFTIELDLSQLEAFQNALATLPERVESVLLETMREAEEIGYTALTDYPEQPQGEKWLNPPGGTPPAWDSEKQKRAFFATNGFEGGIPHERMGALGASFEKTEPVVSAGLISARVFSPEDWVRFVMSHDPEVQSNIHKTRWQTDSEAGEKIRPEVVELFSSRLITAVREALHT